MEMKFIKRTSGRETPQGGKRDEAMNETQCWSPPWLYRTTRTLRGMKKRSMTCNAKGFLFLSESSLMVEAVESCKLLSCASWTISMQNPPPRSQGDGQKRWWTTHYCSGLLTAKWVLRFDGESKSLKHNLRRMVKEGERRSSHKNNRLGIFTLFFSHLHVVWNKLSSLTEDSPKTSAIKPGDILLDGDLWELSAHEKESKTRLKVRFMTPTSMKNRIH